MLHPLTSSIKRYHFPVERAGNIQPFHAVATTRWPAQVNRCLSPPSRAANRAAGCRLGNCILRLGRRKCSESPFGERKLGRILSQLQPGRVAGAVIQTLYLLSSVCDQISLHRNGQPWYQYPVFPRDIGAFVWGMSQRNGIHMHTVLLLRVIRTWGIMLVGIARRWPCTTS